MDSSGKVMKVLKTDVLVLGSSSSAMTYARKLADSGIDVILLGLASESPPAAVKASISSTKVEAAPSEKTSSFFSAAHSIQSAADRERGIANIIGCVPRPHSKLEQSDLFTDTEWEHLYIEAEELLKVHSNVFEKSIRHELVKRTLQEKLYDHGARNFLPMPLAVRKSSNQTVEWACSTVVLGGMVEKNNCFKSCNDSVCVKLLGSGVSKGRPEAISGALCKNLFDSTEFEIQAKKYVLADADVDNARLLLDSGWSLDGLPALGRYLIQPVVATSKVVLSAELMGKVPSDPFRLGWKGIVETYRNSNPDDPISVPKHDPLPQVYSPVSEAYPWHAQLYRGPNSKAPAGVDERVIIDLRWLTSTTPVFENSVSFHKDFTDAYGRCQSTPDFRMASDDKDRSQRMIHDMVEVAGKLGGYYPGCEPSFEELAPLGSGTTRAGRDPKTSVCDRYGKVWGSNNVYVGGPSVLPTAMAASDTFVAVCFAIAGADQIISELRVEP